MPYVKAGIRERIDSGGIPESISEFGLAIARLINGYRAQKSPLAYAEFNEAVGALECAKLELYRRMLAPYEHRKIAQNGDVFTMGKG